MDIIRRGAWEEAAQKVEEMALLRVEEESICWNS
jgi:hypothetical protein